MSSNPFEKFMPSFFQKEKDLAALKSDSSQKETTQKDREQSERELSSEAVLLRGQIARVKNLYAEELGNKAFMTERVWALLTMIELYSPNLAMHCIRTCQIIEENIQYQYAFKSVHGEAISICLGEELKREGISEEDMLVGGMLHDIGKLYLPLEVLDNTVNDEEALWLIHNMRAEKANELLHRTLPHFDFPQGEGFTANAIEEILKDAHIRPTHILSVATLVEKDVQKGVLTEEAAEEALDRVKEIFHKDPKDVLFREFIDAHEKFGQVMMTDCGFSEAGKSVAGVHHGAGFRELQLSQKYPSQPLKRLLAYADAHQHIIQQSRNAGNFYEVHARPHFEDEPRVEQARALVQGGDPSYLRRILDEIAPVEQHKNIAAVSNDDLVVAQNVVEIGAELADEEQRKAFNGTGRMHVSIAQLSDVRQALEQIRSYKQSWDFFDVLFELVNMAKEERRVNPAITSVVVAHELEAAGHDLYKPSVQEGGNSKLFEIQLFIKEQQYLIADNIRNGELFYTELQVEQETQQVA